MILKRKYIAKQLNADYYMKLAYEKHKSYEVKHTYEEDKLSIIFANLQQMVTSEQLLTAE